MTNGDIVRRLSDVGLASLLSSIKHSADYESDDYDPEMLAWIKNEAEDGMKALLEDQEFKCPRCGSDNISFTRDFDAPYYCEVCCLNWGKE